MRAIIFAAAACLAAACAADGGLFDFEKGSEVLNNCQTLDVCMDNLDRMRKFPFGATSDDDPIVSKYLQRFGDGAKRALLVRATGSDPSWRNYAGALLMDWPQFTPDDVPQLIAALKLQPQGWIARPLGRVGTPEAIQALVDDVREHDTQGQSSFALEQLGTKAVPYLMPLLEQDERHAYPAASILRGMGDRANSFAPEWASLAADETKPVARRIAALRALQAIGTRGQAQGPKLRPLLSGHDAALRGAAQKTLAAIGDISILEDTLRSCKLAPEPYSALHFNAWCLEKVAAFGPAAKEYGPQIADRFLSSANGTDRNVAASVLGYIGDQASVPKLIAALHDPDWRVVYAAARALGWLRAEAAAPALEDIARSHWLPPVRDIARAARDSLKPDGQPLPRTQVRLGGSNSPDVPLEIDAQMAADVAPCTGGKWRFGQIVFAMPTKLRMSAKSGGPDRGEFTASDEGEWGGGVWYRRAGKDFGLPKNAVNSEGVEPSSTGAVALFGELGDYLAYNPNDPAKPLGYMSNGPSGFGYVLSMVPQKDGTVTMREIARLPRAADVMTTIGPDLFAVWSGGRVVVFSLDGIKGLAECVAGR